MRQGLSWRHVQALLLLQDNTRLRRRLWKRAVRDGLSGKQLFHLVRQEARRVEDPDVQRRARVIDSQMFHAAARRCVTVLRWLDEVQAAVPESAILTPQDRRRVGNQVARPAHEKR